MSFWNTERKEVPPFKNMLSLPWFYSLLVLTQHCSLLYSTSEITATWCGSSGQTTHTGYTQQLTFSDRTFSWEPHVCFGRWSPINNWMQCPEAPRGRIWPGSPGPQWLAILLSACKWWKALSELVYNKQIPVHSRDVGYSRMWCFINWVDLFHCPQESMGLLSKRSSPHHREGVVEHNITLNKLLLAPSSMSPMEKSRGAENVFQSEIQWLKKAKIIFKVDGTK